MTATSFVWIVSASDQADLTVTAAARGTGQRVMFGVLFENHGPATATNGAATVTQPANLTGPFTDGVRWICTGVQTSNTTVAQLLTDWDATSLSQFRQAHQRSDVQWSGDNVLTSVVA